MMIRQVTLRLLGVFGIALVLTGVTNTPSGSFTAAAAEAHETTWSDEPMAAGRSLFAFDGWSGPAVPIWAYVPVDVDRTSAPIMFLMHGAKRDSRRYLEEWVDEADTKGFIIVAPQFEKSDWRGSYYNRGAVLERSSGELRERSQWSFSAIEPIFDAVVAQLGSSQDKYTMYGHSAGAQFIHRFMFLHPNARVKRYLPANAGWYSFPDMSINFPYGLGGIPVSEEDLRAALAQDVVLLLGDQDIDTEHSSLNRSKGAMAQGEHRFARGKNFHAAAKALAEKNGWEFNWTVRVIPDVAHSNGGIAAGAFDLVE